MADIMTRWSRQAVAATCVLLFAGSACDDKGSPAAPPPPAPVSETFTAADGTRFAVQVVITGLEVPWSLAFAPDGRLFVSERPGRVRVVQNGSLLAAPALTLTDVAATGESGLLGLTLHPDFATNHFVYLAYTSRGRQGGLINRVVRYRELGNTLGEPLVLIDEIPAANIHDGSRVRFGPDGKLYVTMGDAANAPVAQDLASLNGKIYRLNDDGSLPSDNPFPSSPIYSYGHRNPQGIAWHPVTGELWETEHGATGNDEVNRVTAGANYGWPVIEADRTQAGMVTPVLFFNPSIAPSGASFYTGATIAGFRQNLFFATLAGRHIHRVRFDPNDPRQVLADERLLQDRFGRIRDIVTGPDGALYFATCNRDGRGTPAADDDRIVKIIPAP
jgi:glucose/arabinose dehydrogenase